MKTKLSITNLTKLIMTTASLLVLCTVMTGCASSAANRTASRHAELQAILSSSGGTPSQSTPALQLVSINF